MSGSSSSPGCSPAPLNWEMSSSSGISMDTSAIGMAGKGHFSSSLMVTADPQAPGPQFGTALNRSNLGIHVEV